MQDAVVVAIPTSVHVEVVVVTVGILRSLTMVNSIRVPASIIGLTTAAEAVVEGGPLVLRTVLPTGPTAASGVAEVALTMTVAVERTALLVLLALLILLDLARLHVV